MRLTRSWYLEVARDSHTHQACARTTQTAHALVFGRVSLGGYICGIGHSRCACTWRVSAATSSSCTAPPHIWVQCSFDFAAGQHGCEGGHPAHTIACQALTRHNERDAGVCSCQRRCPWSPTLRASCLSPRGRFVAAHPQYPLLSLLQPLPLTPSSRHVPTIWWWVHLRD
jgi:hypothetical protein